jgi:hypothetical protein
LFPILKPVLSGPGWDTGFLLVGLKMADKKGGKKIFTPDTGTVPEPFQVPIHQASSDSGSGRPSARCGKGELNTELSLLPKNRSGSGEVDSAGTFQFL